MPPISTRTNREQGFGSHESTWLLSEQNNNTDNYDDNNQYRDTNTHLDEYSTIDGTQATQILGQEAKKLAKSSMPLIVAYILQYSFNFISMLMLGHIGPDELAAAGLANVALVAIVYSPIVGLASALDTYCSTAYTASQDKTLVGFHLQRGIIAVSTQFLLITPPMWYMETILLWLNQDPRVAMLCGQFVRVQLLGAIAWMYFECVKRFLQAQGIMRAGTIILIMLLPIHIANSYLLMWSPTIGFGFLGAAAANVLTNWLVLAAIIIYTRYSRARAAWGGWTLNAFKAMPQYFRLAVPSMIMICCEWVILDLLVLAASYLGSTTLAAQSIIINTCSVTYQIPDGLSVAVCNRVGNLIGQGRARRARLAAWLSIFSGMMAGVLTLILVICIGNLWGGIYSDDEDVIACVAAIMPACAVFQMLDAMNSVGSGVLRSLGRQNAGALINFPVYYLLGFPLGLYLTYGHPHIGVLGLWYGICTGVGLAVVLQLLICIYTNWSKEVQRCMERVHKDRLSHSGESSLSLVS
ncbi:ethionine resistance protein [Coemansia spiralis]|uniref:Ethionine resistance protein n=2 Tax=Coemansia TaxID=4863 RepID=A0A9W8L044_9FUNG|nr:mate-domain-containing protein [Coemansia spiralis]KAJ1995077.1 ethionine resistance protein [Coemansia umbellata]KAJ2624007.1 ethionine resistance protein [Coemansia sp. RSA 1358]KAJ2679616.1 ethionine resistance protein [Coemansia spiralis]